MREGEMKRGCLSLALQLAFDPSPFTRSNLKSGRSNPLSASRIFVARHCVNNSKTAAPACVSLRSCIHKTSNSPSISCIVASSSSRRRARFSEAFVGSNSQASASLRNNWRKSKIPRQFPWFTRDLEAGRRVVPQGFVRPQPALVTMASGTGGPPEGYRSNVGICLVNGKNEVFVASRLDIPDSWQMPQGGVDEGEEPQSAALRELQEETGVTSVQVIGEVQEWLTYDFPTDVKTKITRLWGKEWAGQAQKWFLFRFVGDDSEVDLAGDGKEPPEFGNWKWLPAEKVLEAAVEFKRPVYAQAFKSLAIYIDSWSKL